MAGLIAKRIIEAVYFAQRHDTDNDVWPLIEDIDRAQSLRKELKQYFEQHPDEMYCIEDWKSVLKIVENYDLWESSSPAQALFIGKLLTIDFENP
jgi:hypothetical protein